MREKLKKVLEQEFEQLNQQATKGIAKTYRNLMLIEELLNLVPELEKHIYYVGATHLSCSTPEHETHHFINKVVDNFFFLLNRDFGKISSTSTIDSNEVVKYFCSEDYRITFRLYFSISTGAECQIVTETYTEPMTRYRRRLICKESIEEEKNLEEIK